MDNHAGTPLGALWQAVSGLWERSGSTSEPVLALEMSATNNGTLRIDQENPMIVTAVQQNKVTSSESPEATSHVTVDVGVESAKLASRRARRSAAVEVELEWERRFGSQGSRFSVERRSSLPTNLRGADMDGPHDFGAIGLGHSLFRHTRAYAGCSSPVS